MTASKVNEYVLASLPEWRAALEERSAAAAAAASNGDGDEDNDDTPQTQLDEAALQPSQLCLRGCDAHGLEVFAHLEAVTDSGLEPAPEVLAPLNPKI
jgi:hypothetical protein